MGEGGDHSEPCRVARPAITAVFWDLASDAIKGQPRIQSTLRPDSACSSAVLHGSPTRMVSRFVGGRVDNFAGLVLVTVVFLFALAVAVPNSRGQDHSGAVTVELPDARLM